MKYLLPLLVPVVVLLACQRKAADGVSVDYASPSLSLADARRDFKTRLVRQERAGEAAPEPPAHLFQLVRYPAPAGALAAYISPPPENDRKHPLIIWIVGGFSSSISEIAWTPGPRENDQSASAFREAGILMMYPSFRGGNDNPGFIEGFYGEVEDVIAASEFAATWKGVDPQRIYLGGHSTGGTLALLAAEYTDRFRAVFSFGPVEDPLRYGTEQLPFDTTNPREVELRAPIRWLTKIGRPTFVFEGERRSNIKSLRALSHAPHSPQVSFHTVKGADHFSTLAPLTRLIAEKIKSDEGPEVSIRFTDQELAAALGR